VTFEDYHSMTRWIRENGPLPPSREVRVGERVILDGEAFVAALVDVAAAVVVLVVAADVAGEQPLHPAA